GGEGLDRGGGDGVVAAAARERGETARGASGYGDRVDRVTRKLFGVGRKSPPENFSGGGGVVASGGLAGEDDQK
ncbi:hypothetical protein Tco_0225070, partial [Tanacetum coccineum]